MLIMMENGWKEKDGGMVYNIGLMGKNSFN